MSLQIQSDIFDQGTPLQSDRIDRGIQLRSDKINHVTQFQSDMFNHVTQLQSDRIDHVTLKLSDMIELLLWVITLQLDTRENHFLGRLNLTLNGKVFRTTMLIMQTLLRSILKLDKTIKILG